jgi:hypothetical protein
MGSRCRGMGSRRRAKDAAACSTIYTGVASRRKKIRGRGASGRLCPWHRDPASVGVSEVGGGGGVHGMGRADGGGHGGAGSTLASGQGEGAAAADAGRHAAGRGGVEGKGQEGGDDDMGRRRRQHRREMWRLQGRPRKASTAPADGECPPPADLHVCRSEEAWRRRWRLRCRGERRGVGFQMGAWRWRGIEQRREGSRSDAW